MNEPTSKERALMALAASRARLRERMVPAPEAPDSGTTLPRRVRALWRYWRRRLAETPAASLAMAGVHEMWLHHPWRPLVLRAHRELDANIMPAVRRHPWLAFGGALALGAGVAITRPWRWKVFTEQWRPMRRRASRWLIVQVARAPLRTAFAALFASLAVPAAAEATAQAAEAASEPETPVPVPEPVN
jgi:hypothetical protein